MIRLIDRAGEFSSSCGASVCSGNKIKHTETFLSPWDSCLCFHIGQSLVLHLLMMLFSLWSTDAKMSAKSAGCQWVNVCLLFRSCEWSSVLM